MSLVLDVRNVSKTYTNDHRQVTVLQEVSFSMEAGDSVAVVGPSGSGKTTLLSLCAGLDNPSSGAIELLGCDLTAMTEEGRARLRNRQLGFVFQSFHLMPSLTALENVMLPLELAGGSRVASAAMDLLDTVGLADRMGHYPSQLSGGEQQRVAIARAFINQPKILFADEPTGNLDRGTSDKISKLLFDLNSEKGTTLLLITHDEGLAASTGRVFHMNDGQLSEAQTVGAT